MIETKPFHLTPKKLFKISLRNLFLNPWMIVIIVLLLLEGIWDLTKRNEGIPWILYFLFFYILVLFFLLFFQVKSKKNKNFYKERTYQFEEKFVAYSTNDGSEGKTNWDTFIKARKRKDYYLLWISRNQFIYIPFDCFKTDTDRNEFEEILKNKKLIK